jgi:uncharacterized protein YjbI with pentapeptide repeats
MELVPDSSLYLYPEAFKLTFTLTGENQTHNLFVSCGMGRQKQSLLNGQIIFSLRGGQLEIVSDGFIPRPSLTDPQGLTITGLTSDRWQWSWKGIPYELESLFLGELSQPSLALDFRVNTADVNITDISGVFDQHLTPNQYAVLERLIVKKAILGGQDSGVVSSVSLNHGGETLLDFDLDLDGFQALVGNVIGQEKDHLLHLANIAGLNPLVNLAGGNLTGTDLAGVSLAKANFSHTNFRGANLTDIDLYEANLSKTNLKGADLSGAYIENANFQGADLYNASLALANAIGADFRGANLVAVNLENTNLSLAQVVGATFGSNLGLTPRSKSELIERGAIFEDFTTH